jgi:outer membrane lipoprotein SlyB
MLLLTVPLILLTGPAHAQSGNVYGSGQVQVAGPTESAVVVQVQVKEAEPGWQVRTAGAGIGGALGGLLANEVSGNARYAASVLGMTIGGLLGERAATSTMSQEAQEVILQVAGTNGQPPRILTIVQPAPYDRLFPGEAVYVINTAGKYRVVRQLQQNTTSNM